MKNINYMAHRVIEREIKNLRSMVPRQVFSTSVPAEIEENRFHIYGQTVNRLMIVLRTNGCEHYTKTGGCSMCSHYNGSVFDYKMRSEDFIAQWDSIISGKCNNSTGIDLSRYPIICVYNLGSLLNQNEVPRSAIEYIFQSLDEYKSIMKVIIESRPEYVTESSLSILKNSCSHLVEVGIGVESTNDTIRELCHFKGYENMEIIVDAVNTLHKYGYKALAYVNFKPCFLTEQEAIDDAVKTSIDCFNLGFDAVSIEPTSLQQFSLVDQLYKMGIYRVPWLWSLTSIIHGIYDGLQGDKYDIRIGGYFDENVLSGSQGANFVDRNELFPHQTSSNCLKCTDKYIDAIKKFNETYRVEFLDGVEKCDNCYHVWQSCCKIVDSRPVAKRILDTFGGVYNE